MRTNTYLLSILAVALIVSAVHPVSSQVSHRSYRSTSLLFATDVKVSDDSNYYDNQKEAAVAIGSDGTVYTVWSDPRNGDDDIFFARSSDSMVFTLNLRIDDANSSTNAQNPDIAVDSSDTIYVVWEDFRNGNWDIYLSRSSSGGSSWIPSVPVHDLSLTSGQQHPKIAVASNGNVFVAWEDARADVNRHEIYVARSKDGGLSFTDGTAVGDHSGSHRQHPDLELDPLDRPCLVWEDFRGMDYPYQSDNSIYYATSNDGGNSYINNVRVDDDEPANQSAKRFPDLAISPGGDIYVVWGDRRGGLNDIFFSRSFDGKYFTAEAMVNDVEGAPYLDSSPEVAVDDIGNLYVVWVDSRDGNHTFISHSPDGGDDFGLPRAIDDTQHSVLPPDKAELPKADPDIITGPEGIFCVWEDFRNDPAYSNGIPENSDIYFDWAHLSPDVDPVVPIPKVAQRRWDLISIVWEPSPSPDFSYYEVFLSTISGFTPDYGTLLTTIGDKTATTLNITSLESNRTYHIRLRVTDTGGNKNTSSEISVTTLVNHPPSIEIIEPDGIGDVAHRDFQIAWRDSDPEENATITLAYDLDRLQGETTDITMVEEGEDGEMDSYLWNTSALPDNIYYIVATIDDGVNPPTMVWSKGAVQVSHPVAGKDTTPPSVSYVHPQNGAEDVAVGTVLLAVFSEDVDRSSIRFQLEEALSGKDVPVTWTYWQVNRTLIIEPDDPLDESKVYKATIDTGLSDLLDNIMLQPFSWLFTTRVPPDWGTLTVSLNESNTGNPIEGAHVTVMAGGYTFTGETAGNGRWVVSVPPGSVEVSVDKQGFSTSDPATFVMDEGGSKTIYFTKTSYLANHAPEILSIIGDSPVKVEELIRFTVKAQDEDGDPIEYLWDFGDDGPTDSSDEVWHSFNKAGTYIVICNASDPYGKWDLGDITIIVEAERQDGGNLEYYICALVAGLIFVLTLVTVLGVRNHRRHRLALKDKEDKRLRLEEVDRWEEGDRRRRARPARRERFTREPMEVVKISRMEKRGKKRRRHVRTEDEQDSEKSGWVVDYDGTLDDEMERIEDEMSLDGDKAVVHNDDRGDIGRRDRRVKGDEASKKSRREEVSKKDKGKRITRPMRKKRHRISDDDDDDELEVY